LRGAAGWGEFSPFPDHQPEIVRRWLHAAREAAFESWPRPRRRAIPVNVTVPAVSASRAHAIVSRSHCTTAKVKVASGDDEERVAAVRDALGPHGRLRVDANAAWDVERARRSIKRLSHFDLEYVEQPVATVEEMARLRKVVDVPIAADESIRTAEDPLSVKLAGAADIVVLKVHPLGGVKACLQIAEGCGLPVVVSSALETSVGLAAGVALAAALPELPYACGLATQDMLEGDVVREPLVARRGRIEVRRPSVDSAALREHLVEPSRQDADLERLARLAIHPSVP
jgi:O-succinylbenzoate synthase